MKKNLPAIILLLAFFVGFLSSKLFSSGRKGNITRKTATVISQEKCPISTGIAVKYLEGPDGILQVMFPPVLVSTTTAKQEEIPFDPKKPDEVWQNWKNELAATAPSASSSPWTEKDFDIDADGKNEMLLIADTQISHGGNLLEVVKNGFIAFQMRGVDLQVYPSKDHNGFFVSSTEDLWDGKGNTKTRMTRVIYDSGRFAPIWYQDSCTVE